MAARSTIRQRTARAALDKGGRGEWKLFSPTVHHLELLARFSTPEEVIGHASSLSEVPRVAPRIVRADDGAVQVLVPGDSGYAEAPP